MDLRMKRLGGFGAFGSRMLRLGSGAWTASAGLELFLFPHGIFVGGASGFASLLGGFAGIRPGLWLPILNLPLFLIMYRHSPKQERLWALYALGMFSLAASVLHPRPALTEHPLLAAAFGGICFGIGVGIVLRGGALLDGIAAHVSALPGIRGLRLSRSRRPARASASAASALPVSTTPIAPTAPMAAAAPRVILNRHAVIAFNAGLLSVCWWLYGIEAAFYSLLALLAAACAIGTGAAGLSARRVACVKSSRTAAIRQAVSAELGLTPIWSSDGDMTAYPVYRVDAVRLAAIARAIDADCTIHIRSLRQSIHPADEERPSP
ncbi:YitT family protein [Cohnella nanjingensis]|uniref:YitT family protein n=1 Tax=Cohnella nanjingensis TaxID=1387779 RepID=A0A7X0RVI9_9BACL|nr:YitT family protein [Cohnella nanjingensis]MBB6674390.1 YitT family protein [Cohnella nanjingensis]